MNNYTHITTQPVSRFISLVYTWMFVALFITGSIAYAGAFISPINNYFQTHFSTIFWVSALTQIAIVFALSFAITRMSYPVALGLFLAYSALMGTTMSSIFYIYTTESIIIVFFIAAAMFAAMAAWGYLTGHDLSQMGSILLMVLIGVIVAMLVNFFLKSSMLTLLLNIVGVVVFAGLTAYDMQKLKMLAQQELPRQTMSKVALMGALALYLDFINLFLSMLQLFGKRRSN